MQSGASYNTLLLTRSCSIIVYQVQGITKRSYCIPRTYGVFREVWFCRERARVASCGIPRTFFFVELWLLCPGSGIAYFVLRTSTIKAETWYPVPRLSKNIYIPHLVLLEHRTGHKTVPVLLYLQHYTMAHG